MGGCLPLAARSWVILEDPHSLPSATPSNRLLIEAQTGWVSEKPLHSEHIVLSEK